MTWPTVAAPCVELRIELVRQRLALRNFMDSKAAVFVFNVKSVSMVGREVVVDAVWDSVLRNVLGVDGYLFLSDNSFELVALCSLVCTADFISKYKLAVGGPCVEGGLKLAVCKWLIKLTNRG